VIIAAASERSMRQLDKTLHFGVGQRLLVLEKFPIHTLVDGDFILIVTRGDKTL